MTLEERVRLLEEAAEANQIPESLAVLMRKLEALWQPDAAVLLQPGSIVGSMLGGTVDADGVGLTFGSVRLRWGTASVTWAGGTLTSGNTSVTHGLGRTPAGVFVTPKITAWANWVPWTGAVGATTFLCAAWSTTTNPPAATADTFSWMAIG